LLLVRHQIRTATPRGFLRLLAPPTCYRTMVARAQDVGYREAPVNRRPSVLRTFQKSLFERLRPGRFGVSEHPRQQPDQALDQHHGRHLPSRQDVVPDRNLLIDGQVDGALVDALVAPAHQHQSLLTAQLRKSLLREASALR
jgi:hypothetical protein